MHKYSVYFNRVSDEDIRAVRGLARLSRRWDTSIKLWVYWDIFSAHSMDANNFKVFMLSDRRMFVEVFESTGVNDIIKPQPWAKLCEWKTFVRSDGTMDQKTPIIFLDETNLRLFINFQKNTSIPAIKQIWNRIIQFQKKLPGRGRFRVRKMFERDLKALTLKRAGVKNRKIYDSIPLNDDKDKEIVPESIRHAIRRLSRRRS